MRYAGRQPGEEVTLRYSWRGEASEAPRVGDVLRTSTGKCYLIQEMGRPSTIGQRLTCMVITPPEVLAQGARFMPLEWSGRGRNRQGISG